MTAHSAVYRRVLRRETHASRTAPAVVLAVISTLVLLAALAAGVWALIDTQFRGFLGKTVEDFLASIDLAPAINAAGIVLCLIAIPLIVLALLPGRRGKRGRLAERTAVLVDDDVLAEAIADRVAPRCGVTRSQVTASVARRKVFVRVVPTSGVSIDQDTVREVAAETLASAGFALPVKVTVSAQGVVS